MKKTLSKGVLIFAPVLMGAGPAPYCSNFACYGLPIELLYPNSAGTVFVRLAGDTAALNCTKASGIFLTLHADQPGTDRIYSLLLSIQASGKPISRVRIVEGSPDCEILYVWQNSDGSAY